MPDLREGRGGTYLRIKVQPRAKADEIAGAHAGALKVRLKAPPVEGKANEALVAFLSGLLGVPAADIQIVRGGRAREKRVFVKGHTPEQLRNFLEPLNPRN